MKKLFIFLLLSITCAHSSVADLTEENFESTIKEKKKSIVMFYAPHCGFCEAMKPVYREKSKKFEGNVDFFLMNTNRGKKLSLEYGIEAIPTTIIFENGKEIKRKVGPFNVEMFIDPAKTIKEHYQKCMDGNSSNCMQLADYYRKNGDYNKTVVYGKKSCDIDADSCSYLASIYYYGEIVKKDYEKAALLYEKSCSGGDTYGCRNIGIMYEKGEGITVNHEKSVKFYDKACKGKDFTACYRLANSYEKGVGVKQDYAVALKKYEFVCEGGFSADYDAAVSSCTEIGTFYKDGKGVKKDSKMAFKFYEKSCTYNNHVGCRNLGDMYKSGLGIEKNIKKAIEFYGRACELEDKDACAVMKKLKSEEK